MYTYVIGAMITLIFKLSRISMIFKVFYFSGMDWERGKIGANHGHTDKCVLSYAKYKKPLFYMHNATMKRDKCIVLCYYDLK